MLKSADTNLWTVDYAGGAAWVWDHRGNVLGQGDSKFHALTEAMGKI